MLNQLSLYSKRSLVKKHDVCFNLAHRWNSFAEK